jgi:hypothetical protein
MELEKIEVAALEVQERIKKVDAAFTWPHPTDKGYFTTAIFVRTDDDKAYLIYCPKATTSISIDEEAYNPYLIWGDKPYTVREVKLNQTLSEVGNIMFYVIALGQTEKKTIKKADIEKMFGVKVVE